MILLDTKREFAFVKPVGFEEPGEAEPQGGEGRAAAAPARPAAPAPPQSAQLDVVSSTSLTEPVQIKGEAVVGRKSEGAEVLGLGDRYMSSRHARFHVSAGTLYVTDLDSKNRTFVNDRLIPPHQQIALAPGDHVRMGATTLRLARLG
jgi:predicted component of type VI protein secretion system